ncbi:MAG: biotin/lipoyl-binding protein [Planctomycetota bacterium]
MSAIIGPKVAGLITRIAVDQGNRVKAGDTLIYLEDVDVKQQVAVAEADGAVATAGVERLHADRRRVASKSLQRR